LPQQLEEGLFADAQGLELTACCDGGGSWRVAKNGNLSQKISVVQAGNRDVAGIRRNAYLGIAGDDDIGSIARIALAKEDLPGPVRYYVGGTRDSRRLTLPWSAVSAQPLFSGLQRTFFHFVLRALL
jgi:hypothetical protein